MTNILICTVGGSHQPIVSAIEKQRPDFVIFICTDKDPATRQPGSNMQINGVGNCIKAHPSHEKPTLPNIAVQTGLTAEQFQVINTLSDDLDQIYLDCSLAIDTALSRDPHSQITADYTGGTKSMSAGLVMAALEHQHIELQLVTGSRSDLIKVHDGSQTAAFANIEQIRFERLIAPYRQAWSRFAYSEAYTGMSRINAPRHSEIRAQYNKFKELSRAFTEWDNFNHRTAYEIIQVYARNLPETFKVYPQLAAQLNHPDTVKRDAARLLDLYRNAQRRAAQGRYDDAIARVYRLLEWTAQWLLKTRCDLVTSKIEPADIPPGVQLNQNKDGHWQAGLFAAWQLISHKIQGPATDFIQAEEHVLRNHINIRNASILAHGFEPVNARAWQAFADWLEAKFIPMLRAETARVGVKDLSMQLPDHYPLPTAKQPYHAD